MPTFDVAGFLAEHSPAAPGGEDLEYDPAYSELESLAAGQAERQVGESIIPAEEPDWTAVRRVCLDLLDRSCDLRVAVHLTNAITVQAGLPGLRDCLQLIDGLLRGHWDDLWPQLDPDDDNDPTERMNILRQFGDLGGFLRRLLNVPLVRSRAVGTFTLLDVRVARGQIPPIPDRTVATPALIEAAFRESDQDALTEAQAAAKECLELATSIRSYLDDLLASDNISNLDPMIDVLKEITAAYATGGNADAAESVAEGEGEPALGVASGGGAGGGGGGAATGRNLAGAVNSRQEVLKALELIDRYYAEHEPSSPVPILLKRARRWVSMNFVEVVEEVLPDSMHQLQVIMGPEEAEDED